MLDETTTTNERKASDLESADPARPVHNLSQAMVAPQFEDIALAVAGDELAAQRLIEALYPLVARIVRAYVPRNEPQTEWEQEVFLRFFARLPQYRAQAPLEHWVSRLAVNVCLDALRACRRRRRELRWADLSSGEIDMVLAAAQSSDASHVAATAARELADKLLDTLSADDRIIVQMIDLEERSVAEVAGLTGRTQTGVKVRVFRARRKLRQAYERLLTDEMPAEQKTLEQQPAKQNTDKPAVSYLSANQEPPCHERTDR
jgi:RNA polymerase sigma-70 factor (ECF subfamily)